MHENQVRTSSPLNVRSVAARDDACEMFHRHRAAKAGSRAYVAQPLRVQTYLIDGGSHPVWRGDVYVRTLPTEALCGTRNCSAQ